MQLFKEDKPLSHSQTKFGRRRSNGNKSSTGLLVKQRKIQKYEKLK
jgi:hypothetical protein